VQDPDLVESWILPFLEEARHTEDWYVAHRHDAEDGSFSLQVLVWPPGTGTKIHDHSSWGAYCCAVGSVLEERYERLDDGSRPEYARLKKVWQL
jgi:predicted metal-dependent enzyme (double-stranded beta helix superfamily)